MKPKVISTAKAFKRLVKHDPFGVEFEKEDGSLRRAQGQCSVTHDESGNPLVKGTLSEDQKEADNTEGKVKYFEAGKGYRSFYLHKMTELTVRGRTYKFRSVT